MVVAPGHDHSVIFHLFVGIDIVPNLGHSHLKLKLCLIELDSFILKV